MTQIARTQKLLAQTSEEILNDEAYHLYANLIAVITAFQLGQGPAPTDDDYAIWKAAQQKRLLTTKGPLNTFMPRPDRRGERS